MNKWYSDKNDIPDSRHSGIYSGHSIIYSRRSGIYSRNVPWIYSWNLFREHRGFIPDLRGFYFRRSEIYSRLFGIYSLPLGIYSRPSGNLFSTFREFILDENSIYYIIFASFKIGRPILNSFRIGRPRLLNSRSVVRSSWFRIGHPILNETQFRIGHNIYKFNICNEMKNDSGIELISSLSKNVYDYWFNLSIVKEFAKNVVCATQHYVLVLWFAVDFDRESKSCSKHSTFRIRSEIYGLHALCTLCPTIPLLLGFLDLDDRKDCLRNV